METGLIVSMVLLWIVTVFNLLLTLALVHRLHTGLPRSGLKAGQIAPDFTAQTLTGENVTLRDYAGHPTTLIFISTHCNPCRKLLPEVEALGPRVTQAGANLVLVSGDGREETQDYVREMDIHLPVLVAPRNESPFFQDYQIQSTPSYCTINQQGKVQSAGYPSISGGDWKAFSDGWTKKAILA